MGRHADRSINDLAKSMNPTRLNEASVRTQWSVVPYQSTHNTGGTVMGTNPRESVVNKYLQSWEYHNLFTVGANVFVHNASYNPTGPVGAFAYWAADAIKKYVKSPVRWWQHESGEFDCHGDHRCTTCCPCRWRHDARREAVRGMRRVPRA